MTPEDRAATYEEILVQTARSVVAAGGDAHLVALSALSVYGDAADGEAWVTEDSPVTSSPDASPRCFLEMERTYLAADGRACVFRCGDVFGPGDPPIGDKVAMAHQYLGGSVPFSADALFYRLHVEDAADAVVHALGHRLTGLHNLTHPEVPPTNAALFDALSVERGTAAPGVPRRDRGSGRADLGRPARRLRLHRRPVLRPGLRPPRLSRDAVVRAGSPSARAARPPGRR